MKTMKKYLFMAVAAIAALSSCSSDNEVFSNEAKKALTFTATMESIGGDTRATYDATNKCAAWEEGDEILVTAIVKSYPNTQTFDTEEAVYTAQSAGTTTKFIPKTEGKEVSSNALNYMAYFPASLKNLETENMELPATITEEYGKFNMPMSAQNVMNQTELPFKNLCGVLKITVKNDQMKSVKSIKVSSSNCATSGAFTFNKDKGADLTNPDVPANAVTVTYTESVTTDATGKVFYVAIPAQTYKNLKIELSADGTNYTKSMTTKKDVEILVERNKIYNITFQDNAPTTGTAKAIINAVETDVNWVQLWAGGPKFAEYNIGATSATDDYCDYFSWADNIASTEWGDNWRMPTKEEFEALLENCECEWVDGYNGVDGLLCTGMEEAYESNSIFFFAAGSYDGEIKDAYDRGLYWSSTSGSTHRYPLEFGLDDDYYDLYVRVSDIDLYYQPDLSCPVRPVLNETK